MSVALSAWRDTMLQGMMAFEKNYADINADFDRRFFGAGTDADFDRYFCQVARQCYPLPLPAAAAMGAAAAIVRNPPVTRRFLRMLTLS